MSGAVELKSCPSVNEEKLKALYKLASMGFKLFPTKNKTPVFPSWQSKASGEQFVLRQRLGIYPDANWAVATGQASGIFVLDVDGTEGAESLRGLEGTHGKLPRTLRIRTGRGEHVYFRWPGHPVQNSVSRVADKLDVRGDGGYAICPPSIHENGNHYEFVDTSAPIASAPDWLLELVTEEDVPAPITSNAPIVEGTRNDSLFRQACALFQAQANVEPSAVLSAILAINQTQCKPPLPEDEVKVVVTSAARYASASRGKGKHSETLYWFPLNAYKFLTEPNIQFLTDYQVGWYAKLQAHAWLKAGVLPADPDKLRVLARPSSKAKFLKEHRAVLFDYEETELNGERVLINRRMNEDYSDTLGKWIKRQEAGRLRAEQHKTAEGKAA
jgi:Bifunctional DNA primase/polymerase, N-terminal/Primase C terminal 1 (PriCT-1)